MNFSVREEIIILTAIFCFCLFTIPVILLDAHNSRQHVVRVIHHDFEGLSFKEQLLVNSFEILDTINRLPKRVDLQRNFGLSDLLELTEADFRARFPSVRPKDEFTARYPMKQIKKVWTSFGLLNGTTLKSRSLRLPLRVDWRERGVIGEVQKQRSSCGSCFALGVIETIESMMAIKTGKTVELSIQQLLDCNEYAMGCEGGDPCRLLQWLQSTQSDIQLARHYPSPRRMKSHRECLTERTKVPGVKVKDYSCNNFADHEELLLLYLAYQGPLTVSVNAEAWKTYTGGVLQSCGSAEPNHVAQVVGYDLSSKPPHYIVKNSWGTGFGNFGYLKVAIGRNLCGIAQQVAAVVV